MKSLKKTTSQNKIEPAARSGGKVEIRIPKENELQMSKILLDFAGPLLEMAEDEEEPLLRLAVLCWNLSYLSEEKTKLFLDNTMKNLFLDDIQEKIGLRLLCEKLIEERKKHYSDIKRFITDFKLTSHPQDDTTYLQVVSTPVKEDFTEYFKPTTT